MTAVKYIITAHPKNDATHKTTETIKGDDTAKRWVAMLRENGWVVTSKKRVQS